MPFVRSRLTGGLSFLNQLTDLQGGVAAQQLFGYGQSADPLAYYNLLARMQLEQV
jgi:hypothetical protein